MTTAVATRQGTDSNNADASATFTAADGTLAACVVDMIGHAPTAPRVGVLCAESAARVGAQRGALAGILAAAAIVADPGAATTPEPDGVAILAVATPGDDVRLAWVGDCAAYSWDGTHLRARSTPQSMGEFLRQYGMPGASVAYDAWVRLSLSTATPTNVAVASIPAPELVLVMSDGAVDQIEHAAMEALVRAHAHDPQSLATALVDAARTTSGRRDDTTVTILTPTT
ncbi:hypothetical protein ACWEV4_21175 [Streptomyces sp. NPDC003860]